MNRLFAGRNLDCRKPQGNISSHAHRRVTCILFMQKLRNLCWYDYRWRTEWAPTLAKLVCWNKSMYGTRDAACNGERDWQLCVKSLSFQLGLSSKSCFVRKGTKFQE